MAQAQDPVAYIYEGLWTNWTKGSARGLTLTLGTGDANLLSSALAVFVTLAGGQLWTIFRFTLHQIRATPQRKTTSMLHNHQQIVLRNATTGPATLRLFLLLAWSWRRNARKPFSSCMFVVTFAALHSTLFMVAGTFSSTLVGAGELVLSRSPFCGTLNAEYSATVETGNGLNITNGTLFRKSPFELSIEYIAKKEREFQLSQEYARECYMVPGVLTSSSCNIYQQPFFNISMYKNGSCPFGSRACAEDIPTVSFDTGYLNSQSDFGINAQIIDQLFYRRITNCTALNDAAYTTGWVNKTIGSDGSPPVQIALANYGPSYLINSSATYEYTNFADLYTEDQRLTTTPYQVDGEVAFAGSPDLSSFMPIPEISQRFADVILTFLSFTGSYISEINGAWFAAHQKEPHDRKFASTTWGRDRPVSTLGCTEQHQFCTSRTKCTPLLGFHQAQGYIDGALPLTWKQSVTLERLTEAAEMSSINQVVRGLASGSTPLLAIEKTASETSTLSLGLPDDQWQVEAQYWHSVAMAHLQRIFVEFGTGQVAAETTYLSRPDTVSGHWLCDNMTIRGSNTQSFSVLALSLVLAFGTLIIVVSLTIENLACYIQRHLGRGAARMEMWSENDMLQLQHWTGASNRSPKSSCGKIRSPPGSEKAAVLAVVHIAPNQSGGTKTHPKGIREPLNDRVRVGVPAATVPPRRGPIINRDLNEVPSPNLGHMIQAVSLASYREGFRAGYQGAWV